MIHGAGSMRWALVLAAGLVLSGCAKRGPAPPPAPPPAAAVETIRYEAGACFGRCPMFAFSVSSDGRGVFEGKRFTAVEGKHAFAVTPEQYAAFAAALAPYRPASGEKRYEHGSPLCERVATDMPSVDVRWERAGAEQHLYYYFGCDMEKHEAMADALGNAPDLLPLGELIGERP